MTITTKDKPETESNIQENDKEITEAISYLSKAAEILGFAIAIPKPKNDDDPILGIIVGTPEYIEQISEAHAKLFGGANVESEEGESKS